MSSGIPIVIISKAVGGRKGAVEKLRWVEKNLRLRKGNECIFLTEKEPSIKKARIIKEYCNKDDRIKLFQHENRENKGLIKTVQLGLEKANSGWVIFLESDDTIEPNYIEEKLKEQEKHERLKRDMKQRKKGNQGKTLLK